MNSYKEKAAHLVAEYAGMPREEIRVLLATPPPGVTGDLSLPCFTLARKFRKAPAVIAAEMASQLILTPEFTKAEAVNGYVNFYLNQESFIRETLSAVCRLGAVYGSNNSGQEKTVVLDYSSPNMGKELAFHHLRGTMLGHSLSRILQFCGHPVERVNHLGDWGTSYGKLILMYDRHRKNTFENTKNLKQPDPTVFSSGPEFLTIEDLNRLYRSFAQAAAEEPELEEEARRIFLELERGDSRYRELWKIFRDVTLKELQRLYALLDVEFDHYWGESEYTSQSRELLELLVKKGIAEESQGALVVRFEEGMPPLMLRKSDGSTLYATRDLCAAIHRKQRFGFHGNLYVVDNGQSLHFNQFFKVLRRMGHDWASQCEHVPFGLILNPSEEGGWEKGKTRVGQASLLKDVMETATDVINAIIQEKNPELKNRREVAGKIAVGALVFNDMKTKRLHDVKFNWDKVLSFEGDTGPYVVNAYVRLASILKKSGRKDWEEKLTRNDLQWNRLSEPAAVQLVQQLALLPEKVETAAATREPYHLGQYALTLAERCHQFIHHCRVLGSEAETERLFLAFCAKTVLGNTLTLLCVPTVEAM